MWVYKTCHIYLSFKKKDDISSAKFDSAQNATTSPYRKVLIIVGWFPVLFVFITILLLLTRFFFYFQCFSSALTFFYRHAIEKPRLFSNPRLFSKPATFFKPATRDPPPLGKLLLWKMNHPSVTKLSLLSARNKHFSRALEIK